LHPAETWEENNVWAVGGFQELRETAPNDKKKFWVESKGLDLNKDPNGEQRGATTTRGSGGRRKEMAQLGSREKVGGGGFVLGEELDGMLPSNQVHSRREGDRYVGAGRDRGT